MPLTVTPVPHNTSNPLAGKMKLWLALELSNGLTRATWTVPRRVYPLIRPCGFVRCGWVAAWILLSRPTPLNSPCLRVDLWVTCTNMMEFAFLTYTLFFKAPEIHTNIKQHIINKSLFPGLGIRTPDLGVETLTTILRCFQSPFCLVLWDCSLNFSRGFANYLVLFWGGAFFNSL